jgi:hypothetical protein
MDKGPSAAIAGVGLILSGVVGGGLKLADLEIPIFEGFWLQVAVVTFGVALLWNNTDWSQGWIALVAAIALALVAAGELGGGQNGPTVTTTTTATSAPTTSAASTSTSPDQDLCESLLVSVVSVVFAGESSLTGDEEWEVVVALRNESGLTAELPGVGDVQFLTASGTLVEPIVPPPPEHGDTWFFPFELPGGSAIEKPVVAGAGAEAIAEVRIGGIGTSGDPFSSCEVRGETDFNS